MTHRYDIWYYENGNLELTTVHATTLVSALISVGLLVSQVHKVEKDGEEMSF